jgi:2-methylisocitrate lyase-like PEP mutase family enzyme
MESQSNNKAIQFRQLHRGPGVLILPNAWDVASAHIFEDAGFPAIATTSAGIAFSLGHPDGQRIPREEMMARIGRITRGCMCRLALTSSLDMVPRLKMRPRQRENSSKWE